MTSGSTALAQTSHPGARKHKLTGLLIMVVLALPFVGVERVEDRMRAVRRREQELDRGGREAPGSAQSPGQEVVVGRLLDDKHPESLAVGNYIDITGCMCHSARGVEFRI